MTTELNELISLYASGSITDAEFNSQSDAITGQTTNIVEEVEYDYGPEPDTFVLYGVDFYDEPVVIGTYDSMEEAQRVQMEFEDAIRAPLYDFYFIGH